MKKNSKAEDETMIDAEAGELLERLTDRVERAVDAIQKLRKERDELRARLDEVEKQLDAQGSAAEELSGLQGEIDRFQNERHEVRSRIGRILDALASLDEE
ncbi:MAG: cell division protein ZapB [Thermoanaerobaculia bacterium]